MTYYTCITDFCAKVPQGGPHGAPYIRAAWLEEEAWRDVRQFLENPGEVLERVRAQMESDDGIEQLESEHERLERELADLRDERLTYLRQHAKGAIESEEELDTLLNDVRGRTGNTRLLLANVEVALESRRERRKLADSAAAWLATLRGRLSEVEEDTETAYLERRQLVQLLVASIMVGRHADGHFYCCAPCASMAGVGEVADRA